MTESIQDENDENKEDIGGYAPALHNCPHVQSAVTIPKNVDEFPDINVIHECDIVDCDSKENWVCLKCNKILCSRYGNKHMAKHYETNTNKEHCIAMGIGDLSFWCYQCENYLHYLSINEIFDIYKIAYIKKFGEEIPNNLGTQSYSFNFPITIKNSKICQYMNWGGFCAFFIILFADKTPSKQTIRHEMIHYYQWKEMLIIPYIFIYLLFLIYGLFKYGSYKRAYCSHPFEVEATLNEANDTYLEKRKYFSWIKYIGMEIPDDMVHYKPQ